MGGAFASWKASHSIPANIRLSNVRIHLPDGRFDLRAFIARLEEAPDALARRLPEMTAFARTWRATWNPSGSETERSLLSFVLQEYEAASLRAKMAACEAHVGVKAANLQQYTTE